MFQIEVKDNGPMRRRSDLARLPIIVTPAPLPSPSAPYFEEMLETETRITENYVVGSFVNAISAFDPDNDEVRYAIVGKL